MTEYKSIFSKTKHGLPCSDEKIYKLRSNMIYEPEEWFKYHKSLLEILIRYLKKDLEILHSNRKELSNAYNLYISHNTQNIKHKHKYEHLRTCFSSVVTIDIYMCVICGKQIEIKNNK